MTPENVMNFINTMQGVKNAQQKRQINALAMDPNSPQNQMKQQEFELKKQKLAQEQQKYNQEQLLGMQDFGIRAFSHMAEDPAAARLYKQQFINTGFATPEEVAQFEAMPIDQQIAYSVDMRDKLIRANQQYMQANRESKLYTPEEMQQRMMLKPAPAQTNLRVINKQVDSLAGTYGPIMKEERTKATGAVRMFNAAKSIDQALDSGDIYAGPGSSVLQVAAQIGAMMGFGGDQVVRTRQVEKALSEMAVEARKELAGQGQVTESEAAAVEKAYSGKLADMTIDEVRLVSELSKRGSQRTIMQYNDYLESIPEEAQPLKPMFQLRGTENILNYQPQQTSVESPQQGQAPQQQTIIVDY